MMMLLPCYSLLSIQSLEAQLPPRYALSSLVPAHGASGDIRMKSMSIGKQCTMIYLSPQGLFGELIRPGTDDAV